MNKENIKPSYIDLAYRIIKQWGVRHGQNIWDKTDWPYTHFQIAKQQYEFIVKHNVKHIKSQFKKKIIRF